MPGHPLMTVTATIVIDPALCKACGICIGLCPRTVLTAGRDGLAEAEHPDACTACRSCELHCPDFAITVHESAEARTARAHVRRS